MKLYKLNKTVLKIQNNPARFLNGLTSNSLDQPQNAFLNIHGRIIAVFDQVRINEDEFWIAVGSAFVRALLKHVEKYVMLSSVGIEELKKHVYFDIDEAQSEQDGMITIPQKKGRVIISDAQLEAGVSEEEFTRFRIKYQIPLQGIDYTDEFALNISEGDFISYEKGCFLGQEPISKVHNRSSPTWQLVVEYEDNCDEKTGAKMTSKVLDPDDQRTRGFIFINNKK